MRDIIAQLSNVKRLQIATRALLHASRGTSNILGVSGEVGRGKSTATRHVCCTEDAVWIEAQPDWTPSWMCGDLAVELGAERKHGTRRNFENVIGALREHPRAVFIDEADRLCKRMHLAETLRAIHDQSGAPLVLVGMSQLPRAIKAVPQLKSRVADWVEFLPCDLRDARTMAEALCEIEVADDLVREIHQKCGGSARKIRTALERVERLARLRTKRRIALGDLPDGFSLTYDFDARGKVPAPSGSEEKSNVVSLRAENA